MILFCYFIIFCLLCSPLATYAARPMVTDDARLTKGGSCQVETWVKAYSGGHEFWALPACNPFGNFEVTIGTAVSKLNGEPTTNDYIFQAKTLLKELSPDGWGLGMALGTAQHESKLHPGPNGLGSTYVYFPISHSFFEDQLITHINFGYIYYKEASKESLTWGAGGEYKLRENLLYVLESFGDQHTSAYVQTGLRYSVVPDIFQIDTTVGRQFSKDDSSWLSFGIRYTPDKLF